jgi:hypothetical protein
MPIVTELGKAHLNTLNRTTEEDIRAKELEALALSIQNAMGIEREYTDNRAIRYQKLEGKPINPKLFMDDDETGSLVPCCDKKRKKKKDAGDIDESDVQAGDLVEALEKELA